MLICDIIQQLTIVTIRGILFYYEQHSFPLISTIKIKYFQYTF